MPKSRRLLALENRVAELEKHLLSFLSVTRVPVSGFSDLEHDLTRAYILLVHAELEAYCEDLAAHRARKARETYLRKGKITPVLRSLLAYYAGKKNKSWQCVRSPTREEVEAAHR